VHRRRYASAGDGGSTRVPAVEAEPDLAADRNGLCRVAIVEGVVVAGCGAVVGGSDRRPGGPGHFEPRSAAMRSKHFSLVAFMSGSSP